MSIISNIQIPPKIISTDGDIISILLIVIISISFLLAETKYWNDYVASTLNIFSDPMLLIFIAIIIFKILTIIKT